MNVQRLINLDRISCVLIAENEGRVYLVFQDGRHNYGYKVNSLDYAQNALKTIEKSSPKWWRVLGEPIEMFFKMKEGGEQ